MTNKSRISASRKLIVVEDFAFPLEESFSIWVLEPAEKVESLLRS